MKKRPGLAQLLNLAWPMIVSRSTQAVVGLADALMVAHLGEAALASVTTGSLNGYALLIFPFGITFILSSFSSQLAGRKDFLSARRYGWYGIGLAVAAQVLAFVSIPFIRPVIYRLGYSPEVSSGLVTFLSIRLLFTGPAVGLEALGNYYGGLGNTKMIMRANITAMVLNVFFNWLLIDGHWGFPAWGIAGSATASVIATSIAFLWFFGVFLVDGRKFRQPVFRLREFVQLLRFGLPSGVNWAFEFFAFVAFVNLVVGSLGTTRLAAMMTVLQVNSISFMPAFGIASAGAILAGQAIGARRKSSVPGIAFLTLRTTCSWMGLVAVFNLVFPVMLLTPFASGVSPDSPFMKIGVRMLMFSALWQLFDAASMTFSEILRSAGDTFYAMWVRGIIAWLIFLPGAWVSVRVFGGTEYSAMTWLMTYLFLLALVLFIRFSSGAWRKIRLVEEAPIP